MSYMDDPLRDAERTLGLSRESARETRLIHRSRGCRASTRAEYVASATPAP